MTKLTSSSNKIEQIKFEFNEPYQRQIFERLVRLVGIGIANFYKDACRFMAIQPPFISTTHIVGHLIREIESALRDVLELLTGYKKSGGRREHENEVKVVLKYLDIKETDPIAITWLGLTGDNGFHSKAHRNNLDLARPMDQDFLEFWHQSQTILDVILDRYESQYTKVFLVLDKLAKKSKPTKKDAQTVHIHIPNNYVAHHRFFSNLNNPEWLQLLNNEGMFTDPPKPEHDPEMRHFPWPATIYLERMAPIKPQLVKEILKKMKLVDNFNVKNDLIKTTIALPKKERSELIGKIKDWVKMENSSSQIMISESVGKLIDQFITDGKVGTVFELVTSLLEITPDPQRKEKSSQKIMFRPKLEPQTHFEHWHYVRFLEKEFKKLIKLNPNKSFDLACKLLLDYLELQNEDRNKKDHKYQDLSYISRRAIENHEQNHDHDDIHSALITTVRDIGLEIIKKKPTSIKIIFPKLINNNWTLFYRIGFYLLSESPESARGLVEKQLSNEAFFDNSHVEHEYARLMGTGFKILTHKKQNQILGWIENAEQITMRIKKSGGFNSEKALRIKDVWKRDQLSFMKDDLPKKWKKHYEVLVKKYGEPEHPDFPSYSTSWVGPTSDIKSKDFIDMGIDNLIKKLEEWEPKKESHHRFGHTKEGVARELGVAVKLKPELFTGIAHKLKGLDPTYIRSYFQVFGDLAQHDYQIDWKDILDLSLWVIQQPLEMPGRMGEIMDQDPDWGWARKAISSLISKGLNNNLIPCELRQEIWAIIEPITHDPNPTIKDDEEHEKNSDDAYGFSINSSRGEAMGATIEYALWVYRCTEDGPNGKEKVKSGFDLMPEVRTVLDWHLDADNDPSTAVRAVYGRFFPWLLLMDKQWTLNNADRILPPNDFDNRLYRAAWDTIMLYVPAYNEPFMVLKDRYREAIRNLGKVNKERSRSMDRDQRLVEHLMIFYGRGIIDLSDNLLEEFWKSANNELRGHALDFVGRSLKNQEADVSNNLLERSKGLWESRIKSAITSSDKKDYEDEVSAFGWWFASGRFEDKWSCEQYLEALNIGRKTQSDYFVVERLAELVKTLPTESIKILAKLALVDEPGWVIIGNKAEIRSIITIALNSPEELAQKEAESLVNRLIARGYTEFGDLIK